MTPPPLTTLLDVETLHANLEYPSWVILDTRFNLADVAAGRQAYLEAHIPSAAYVDLDEDLSGPPLTEVDGNTPPEAAVFHCGSGVTACQNLLALRHAGLGDGRLYVGSWREWCADSARPVATGPNP